MNREEWLTLSAEHISTKIVMPAAGMHMKDMPKYRVSVGFPKGSRGGRKAIGQCWPDTFSSDGSREVFICPTLTADNALAVLVHELIHVADNCKSGHKGFCKDVARKAGLVGKLTATNAGEELTAKLQSIAKIAGTYPHAPMQDLKNRPKQATRLLKVACGECGFVARASAKVAVPWSESDYNCCPLCEAPLSFSGI